MKLSESVLKLQENFRQKVCRRDLKNQIPGGGDMAQSVNGFFCKHENLNLMPKPYFKKLSMNVARHGDACLVS